MAFTASDKREVFSLLGKITTTMDGLGRSMRDARLVGSMNPHWDQVVRNKIANLEGFMKDTLNQYRVMEDDVVSTVNSLVPPE